MRGYARIPGDYDLLRTLVSGITEGRGKSIDRSCAKPMPNTKPRYTIIDTGDLSDQLDQAERRWPEISDRKELLLKLVAAGNTAIEEEGLDRARAVEETAGTLSGVYAPAELEQLGEDWPE